jgi:hypothetical protein
MGFNLAIHTENAAFDEDALAPEVARILREIAARLDGWDGYDKYQTVFDSNGNDVGRFRLTREG